MKAIGFKQAGPITASDALIEFEAATPTIGPHDLLVEVRGISVNPVDVKVRAKSANSKWVMKSDMPEILPGRVQTPNFKP